jgi:hypothetical protein
MSEPTPSVWYFASPAWHPTWRDKWAVRIANFVLRVMASREYCALSRDMYERGFRCAVEHSHLEVKHE